MVGKIRGFATACMLAFVSVVPAQDFAPELVPLVTQHQTALAALDAQRTAAVARVQQTYLAALDSAEKSATTAGTIEVVAAITKEREALKSGLMAPVMPEGLPKTLQPIRKAYFDGTARVAAEASPRQKALDTDYLRALAALQQRAAGKPELAKQIAAEKEKLFASVGGSVSGSSKPRNEHNAVINGTFEVVDKDGHPQGWHLEYRAGDVFKVTREGAGSFVRLTMAGLPGNVWAIQEIAVPPRAKTMTMHARVRGKWSDRKTDDSNWGANFSARFIGADEQLTGPWFINIGGREDGGWKELSKSAPVENGAKRLRVQFGAQWVAGTFDFADIEVEFR